MPEATPNPILFYNDGTVRKYSEWGTYPVFYVANDYNTICATCVQENLEQCQDSNDSEWFVTGHGINYENYSCICGHCSQTIESAYGGSEA